MRICRSKNSMTIRLSIDIPDENLHEKLTQLKQRIFNRMKNVQKN